MASSLQVIDGGRDTAKHVRKSVHSQAVTLGDGIQAVARRNGISYNRVLDLVVEQEREISAKREKLAYLAGRASLWRAAA